MKVGQKAVTKVDYYDYKELIKAGTEFTIISFPPYPMKQGCFVYGKTNEGKSVRLAKNEINPLKN